jgi:hypothetical protein
VSNNPPLFQVLGNLINTSSLGTAQDRAGRNDISSFLHLHKYTIPKQKVQWMALAYQSNVSVGDATPPTLINPIQKQ